MMSSAPSVEGRLLPHHIRELRASGLSDKMILAAGIHSEINRAKLAIHLRRKQYPQKWGPAIVFPFRDLNGNERACRIKPDYVAVASPEEDRPKYLSPTDSGVLVYFPPEVADRLQSIENDVFLTEGEKKALKLTQEGFTAIGLTGVSCWHQKNKMTLLPELTAIPWRGRRVLICFDSDAAENPQIQQEESLLAGILTTQHGAEVRIIRIPARSDAATGCNAKVGVDDFLVDRPVSDFCKLIEHARDPESPDADELRLNARDLEPADEAKRYLLERMAKGYRRLVFWRGEFWLWKGGCWRMQQAVDLKADVVNYLNPRYSRLAVPHANNVVMQLQAQSHLMPWIDQPAWLGDCAPEWDPRDVLPMKNALVYLPSFLEQKSDYSTPPTPRFFSPTVLSYDWDPNPPRPAAWLGFLASIFENDDEALSTLQEWAGYLLTGDTSQQKMLALFGPKRAGKGTICRVLQALLGEQNCCGPTLNSLGTQFGLSPLIGKSLGVISDARMRRGAESAIITERILSITGEDTLTIDRKFREPFTGKLPTRLMLVSNELPRLSDASGAIVSRMLVLRLSKTFFGREDVGLNQRLRQELPGILHWGIEGWRRLRDRGYFEQPASGSDLVDHLNELSSPIGAFIADQCDLGQAYRVPTAELYQAWRAWANAKGMSNDVGTEGEFGKDLRAAAAGINRRRNRNMGDLEYFYLGIRLKVTI